MEISDLIASDEELLITDAVINIEKAKEVLLVAARYMRDGQVLPRDLAIYLASAFESAVNNPVRYSPENANDTGHALLVALNLKTNNRRPTFHREQVWLSWKMVTFINGLNVYDKKLTKKDVMGMVAREFRISVHSVRSILAERRKQQR